MLLSNINKEHKFYQRLQRRNDEGFYNTNQSANGLIKLHQHSLPTVPHIPNASLRDSSWQFSQKPPVSSNPLSYCHTGFASSGAETWALPLTQNAPTTACFHKQVFPYKGIPAVQRMKPSPYIMRNDALFQTGCSSLPPPKDRKRNFLVPLSLVRVSHLPSCHFHLAEWLSHTLLQWVGVLRSSFHPITVHLIGSFSLFSLLAQV